MTSDLFQRNIAARLADGHRLSGEDGIGRVEDPVWLGRLAHRARLTKSGDTVTFHAGRESWPDACAADCGFCAISRGDEPAPTAGWDARFHRLDVNGDDWSRAHRAAHSRGHRTVAYVVYDGDAERLVERLMLLRELQDETAGFDVVVPLPRDTVVAVDALRAFALCRLVVDNVDHVQCLWDDHGLDVAQLSVNFGVDDLDGDVTDYRATHDAVDRRSVRLTADELAELIQDAGFTPVERDADRGVLREYEPPVPAAIRRAEPQKVWA